MSRLASDFVDRIDNPLAFLEATFTSAACGGEFAPTQDALFGLARVIATIRADAARLLDDLVDADDDEPPAGGAR